MSVEQRITARDLLEVLVEADALEIFNQLPDAAQEDLASWIGAARDDDSHWVRIQALVAAMTSSPLNPAASPATGQRSNRPRELGVDDVDGVRFNDLLAAIRDSNLLGSPEGAGADESARRDGDAAATLRVVYEVMTVLKESGVLDIFFHLPEGRQADFLRWVGTVADRGLRSDRTATFVAALQESPIASLPDVRARLASRSTHEEGGPVTEAEKSPLEVARTYLQKGEEDEAVLRLLATEAQMPDSALGMHAHQAVERYLLAVLTAEGIEPGKTRDLGELMGQMPSVPTDVRAAEFLTAYEVLERDPLGEVAALDRDRTLDVVNRIRGWAEAIVTSAG